jgi:hypothetical protein
LNKKSFLEEGRRIRNDLWFILTIAQFTQVRLQEIGSKNMACATCHIHLPYLPDLAYSDFYLFPTVKAKLERIQVTNEDQFFESLQEILRDLDREELNGVFQTWVRQIQEVSQGKTR